MTSEKHERVSWPGFAMVALGTFGSDTAAARRYHRRVFGALALLVVWLIGLPALTGVSGRGLVAAATPIMGLLFLAFITFEFWLYLKSLDELARRMQFEAMAYTYMIGMLLAVTLGIAAIYFGWRLNPLWFIFLEPVRGLCLYWLSRRY